MTDKQPEMTEEQRVMLYRLGDNVTGKHVEALDDKAVIVDAGGWHQWSNDKTGESGEKPTVGVQFSALPKVFEYRIPASTLERLEKKLGPAHKREDWVGAVLQFIPKDDGFVWVDAVVSATPEEAKQQAKGKGSK